MNEATYLNLVAEGGDSVAEMTEITVTADVSTAATPLSTAGMIVLFTYRTSKATKPSMLILHCSVPPKELFLMRGAPRLTTENANLESFQVGGNGVECSPSRDKMYDGENTQVQDDIAFPAMMQIGICTAHGDAAVCIDTAVSHHMVSVEFQLCRMWSRRSTAAYVLKDRATSLVKAQKFVSGFVFVVTEVSWYRSTWKR